MFQLIGNPIGEILGYETGEQVLLLKWFVCIVRTYRITSRQVGPSIRSSERCSWSDQRNGRSPIPLVAICLPSSDPNDRRWLNLDSFL
jgi:hypothetical protein